MSLCVVNYFCPIQNSSYNWVGLSGARIYKSIVKTFGDQVSSRAILKIIIEIAKPDDFLTTTIFCRQLSFERRAQPDSDAARCLLQRGRGHRAARDGCQWSEESHCWKNPRHTQKLCQQGGKSETLQILTLFWRLRKKANCYSYSSQLCFSGILHKQRDLPGGFERVGVLRQPTGTTGPLDHTPWGAS